MPITATALTATMPPIAAPDNPELAPALGEALLAVGVAVLVNDGLTPLAVGNIPADGTLCDPEALDNTLLDV